MKKVQEMMRRLAALGISIVMIMGAMPQTVYATGTLENFDQPEDASMETSDEERIEDPADESEDPEDPTDDEDTDDEQDPEEDENPDDNGSSEDEDLTDEEPEEDPDAVLVTKEDNIDEGEILSRAIDPNATSAFAGLGASVITDPITPQSSSDPWSGSYVYYGKYDEIPVKYRVLSSEDLFLDCDSVLYESVLHNESQTYSWTISDVKKGLNGNLFLNKEGCFTDPEKEALVIAPQTHSGLTGDERIFLLTREEVKSYGYYSGTGESKSRQKSNKTWWTRTGFKVSGGQIDYVEYYGELGSDQPWNKHGVSPAFNVDRSSIVFTSVIKSSESSPAEGEVGAEYKFTVTDEDLNVFLTDSPSYYGGVVTIPCTAYGRGDASDPSSIIAVVTDGTWTENGWSEDAQILQYEKQEMVDLKKTGKLTFSLKEDMEGARHLYLFAIEENDAYETDYASEPLEITGIDFEHGDIEHSVSVKQGSNKIDLSELIEVGGKASIDSTKIVDADKILSGSPTISNSVLSVEIKSEAETGKNVIIPVSVKGSSGFAPYTISVIATVAEKIAHDDVEYSVGVSRGRNAIDLTDLIPDGGKTGVESVTDDNSILSENPSISGCKLQINIIDGADVGKSVKVSITVNDAYDYLPYKINVSAVVSSKTVSGLGTNGIGNPIPPQDKYSRWSGCYIYYGKYDGSPVRYRVLSNNTDKFSPASAQQKETVFLDCDARLYKAKFNNSSAKEDAEWEYSDIKAELNGDAFLNKAGCFTMPEKTAIASSEVSERPLEMQYQNYVDEYVFYTALNGEKIFLLDIEDACNKEYGYWPYFGGYNNAGFKGDTSYYWLRTSLPDDLSLAAASGRLLGGDNFNKLNPKSTIYASPAFNVDLSNVVFSSLISSSESPQVAGEAGAEYTLAITDEGLGISSTSAPKNSNGLVTITYAITDKSSTATPDCVMALVTDGTWTENGWSEDAQLLQCAKLDMKSFSNKGTGTFTLDNSISGDYNIYIIALDENDLHETDYASVPVAAGEAKDSIRATVSGYTGTYDGNAHGITVDVSNPASGATVKYGTKEGTYNLTVSPTITNASDSPLTVYYQIAAKGFPTKTGAETVIINKADSYLTAPTARTGLTYDGSDQVLVNAGYVEGGTFCYAVTAKDADEPVTSAFTESLPKAKNAGDYDVWYMVKGDENHNDILPQKVEVNIEAGMYAGNMSYHVTVPANQVTENIAFTLPELPADETYVYVGVTQGQTMISGTPQIDDRTLSFSTTSKPVGTYTEIALGVKVPEINKNYNDYFISVIVTATDKSEAGVSISGGDRQVEYGSVGVKLAGTVEQAGSGAGVWTWKSSNTDIASIDAGTGDVIVKKPGNTFITATYTSESTTGSASICLKVTKKTLDVTWGDTGFAFDGTDHKPTAILTGVLEGEDCTVSVTGEQTNAGVGYIATATLCGANANNYELPYDKETCAFSIGKADIMDTTISLGEALIYNGSAQIQEVVVKFGEYDVTSQFDITGNTAIYPGNYTLTVSAKENGSFTGTATTSFSIARKPIIPQISVEGTYIFTGSEIIPKFKVKDSATETILYNKRDYQYEIANNINAGKGKIILRSSQNSKYIFDETIQEFEIEKAVWKGGWDIQLPIRNYPAGEEVTDFIDISDYLPGCPGALDIRFTSGREILNPTAKGSIIKYTVPAGEAGDDVTLRIIVQSQNYDSEYYTSDHPFYLYLNVHWQSMGLYEKNKKTSEARSSKALTVGKSFTLTAKIMDESVTNKRVVWSSTNPDVATVTQEGKVTARTAGNALITAVSEHDPSKLYTSCSVTVTEAITSMTLDKKSYSFGTGENTTLTAKVLPYTSVQDIKWSTSNKDVVIVCDSEGNELSGIETAVKKVTGKTYDASSLQTVKIIANGTGSAKITAAATDGSGKKAVCSFTVGKPVPEFTVTGKGNATVLVAGKTLAMKVNWGGKALNPKNTGVTWSVVREDGVTDGSDIAVVSAKGVLTGKSEGVVRVVATSKANPGISKQSDPITVYVPIKNVALNKTSGTVSVKGKDNANALRLSVNITPTVAGKTPTGTVLGAAPTVEWKVDPKYDQYLSVTADGLVTANVTAPINNIAVTATVTAYNNYSKKLTCKVSVKAGNPLKSIKISKTSLSIGEGNTATLTATLDPVNPDGDQGYAWSSSNTSVVSVDETGKITANKPGTATITATANSKLVSKGKEISPSASCKVTVKPSVKSIAFTNAKTLSDKGLNRGKTFTLKTKLTLSQNKGKAATTGLVWTSSDESIATVSKKGVVKAIAPGKVTITASSSDDRVRGEIPCASVSFSVYSSVTKIAIDKTKLTLGTQSGSEYGLVSVSSLMPKDVTNPSISWTASNANISLAVIPEGGKPEDGNGYRFKNAGGTVITQEGEKLGIKALVPGTVKLTGVTTDGTKKKVTCNITIRGQVTGFRLKTFTTKTKLGQVELTTVGKYRSRIKKGESLSITPIVDINGVSGSATDKSVKKTYATYKKYTDVSVSYRSSDISVATVDKKGKITVNKKATAGSKATIYVTTADGSRTAQVKITVAE